VAKSKYVPAASLDGAALDEKIGEIVIRDLGQWEFLYEGITVPILFVLPSSPPPPPPPPP